MKKQILLLLAGVGLAAPLSAVILTTEHVDIGVEFDGGEWEFEVHDETNEAAYEPDEAYLFVDPVIGAATRSANSDYDFIGVNAGETYYRLTSSQTPGLLYLGFGTEELNTADFMAWDPDDARLPDVAAQYVRFDLVSVEGPGDFSIYTIDEGGVVDWMATSDGIGIVDSVYLLTASHSHFNLAFTELGSYEVTFTVTSMLASGMMSTSGPATYTFLVPEPSTYASMAGVLMLLATCYLRRRKA